MVNINFTYALKRFYPDLASFDAEAKQVAEVLDIVENRFPGMKSYLVDDQGELRKHVNIFVNGSLIKDRTKLSDALQDGAEVYIMQALSGG